LSPTLCIYRNCFLLKTRFDGYKKKYHDQLMLDVQIIVMVFYFRITAITIEMQCVASLVFNGYSFISKHYERGTLTLFF
jgi:hypothetical protein